MLPLNRILLLATVSLNFGLIESLPIANETQREVLRKLYHKLRVDVADFGIALNFTDDVRSEIDPEEGSSKWSLGSIVDSIIGRGEKAQGQQVSKSESGGATDAQQQGAAAATADQNQVSDTINDIISNLNVVRDIVVGRNCSEMVQRELDLKNEQRQDKGAENLLLKAKNYSTDQEKEDARSNLATLTGENGAVDGPSGEKENSSEESKGNSKIAMAGGKSSSSEKTDKSKSDTENSQENGSSSTTAKSIKGFWAQLDLLKGNKSNSQNETESITERVTTALYGLAGKIANSLGVGGESAEDKEEQVEVQIENNSGAAVEEADKSKDSGEQSTEKSGSAEKSKEQSQENKSDSNDSDNKKVFIDYNSFFQILQENIAKTTTEDGEETTTISYQMEEMREKAKSQEFLGGIAAILNSGEDNNQVSKEESSPEVGKSNENQFETSGGEKLEPKFKEAVNAVKNIQKFVFGGSDSSKEDPAQKGSGKVENNVSGTAATNQLEGDDSREKKEGADSGRSNEDALVDQSGGVDNESAPHLISGAVAEIAETEDAVTVGNSNKAQENKNSNEKIHHAKNSGSSETGTILPNSGENTSSQEKNLDQNGENVSKEEKSAETQNGAGNEADKDDVAFNTLNVGQGSSSETPESKRPSSQEYIPSQEDIKKLLEKISLIERGEIAPEEDAMNGEIFVPMKINSNEKDSEQGGENNEEDNGTDTAVKTDDLILIVSGPRGSAEKKDSSHQENGNSKERGQKSEEEGVLDKVVGGINFAFGKAKEVATDASKSDEIVELEKTDRDAKISVPELNIPDESAKNSKEKGVFGSAFEEIGAAFDKSKKMVTETSESTESGEITLPDISIPGLDSADKNAKKGSKESGEGGMIDSVMGGISSVFEKAKKIVIDSSETSQETTRISGEITMPEISVSAKAENAEKSAEGAFGSVISGIGSAYDKAKKEMDFSSKEIEAPEIIGEVSVPEIDVNFEGAQKSEEGLFGSVVGGINSAFDKTKSVFDDASKALETGDKSAEIALPEINFPDIGSIERKKEDGKSGSQETQGMLGSIGGGIISAFDEAKKMLDADSSEMPEVDEPNPGFGGLKVPSIDFSENRSAEKDPKSGEGGIFDTVVGGFGLAVDKTKSAFGDFDIDGPDFKGSEANLPEITITDVDIFPKSSEVPVMKYNKESEDGILDQVASGIGFAFGKTKSAFDDLSKNADVENKGADGEISAPEINLQSGITEPTSGEDGKTSEEDGILSKATGGLGFAFDKTKSVFDDLSKRPAIDSSDVTGDITIPEVPLPDIPEINTPEIDLKTPEINVDRNEEDGIIDQVVSGIGFAFDKTKSAIGDLSDKLDIDGEGAVGYTEIPIPEINMPEIDLAAKSKESAEDQEKDGILTKVKGGIGFAFNKTKSLFDDLSEKAATIDTNAETVDLNIPDASLPDMTLPEIDLESAKVKENEKSQESGVIDKITGGIGFAFDKTKSTLGDLSVQISGETTIPELNAPKIELTGDSSKGEHSRESGEGGINGGRKGAFNLTKPAYGEFIKILQIDTEGHEIKEDTNLPKVDLPSKINKSAKSGEDKKSEESGFSWGKVTGGFGSALDKTKSAFDDLTEKTSMESPNLSTGDITIPEFKAPEIDTEIPEVDIGLKSEESGIVDSVIGGIGSAFDKTKTALSDLTDKFKFDGESTDVEGGISMPEINTPDFELAPKSTADGQNNGKDGIIEEITGGFGWAVDKTKSAFDDLTKKLDNEGIDDVSGELSVPEINMPKIDFDAPSGDKSRDHTSGEAGMAGKISSGFGWAVDKTKSTFDDASKKLDGEGSDTKISLPEMNIPKIELDSKSLDTSRDQTSGEIGIGGKISGGLGWAKDKTKSAVDELSKKLEGGGPDTEISLPEINAPKIDLDSKTLNSGESDFAGKIAGGFGWAKDKTKLAVDQLSKKLEAGGPDTDISLQEINAPKIDLDDAKISEKTHVPQTSEEEGIARKISGGFGWAVDKTKTAIDDLSKKLDGEGTDTEISLPEIDAPKIDLNSKTLDSGESDFAGKIVGGFGWAKDKTKSAFDDLSKKLDGEGPGAEISPPEIDVPKIDLNARGSDTSRDQTSGEEGIAGKISSGFGWAVDKTKSAFDDVSKKLDGDGQDVEISLPEINTPEIDLNADNARDPITSEETDIAGKVAGGFGWAVGNIKSGYDDLSKRLDGEGADAESSLPEINIPGIDINAKSGADEQQKSEEDGLMGQIAGGMGSAFDKTKSAVSDLSDKLEIDAETPDVIPEINMPEISTPEVTIPEINLNSKSSENANKDEDSSEDGIFGKIAGGISSAFDKVKGVFDDSEEETKAEEARKDKSSESKGLFSGVVPDSETVFGKVKETPNSGEKSTGDGSIGIVTKTQDESRKVNKYFGAGAGNQMPDEAPENLQATADGKKSKETSDETIGGALVSGAGSALNKISSLFGGDKDSEKSKENESAEGIFGSIVNELGEKIDSGAKKSLHETEQILHEIIDSLPRPSSKENDMDGAKSSEEDKVPILIPKQSGDTNNGQLTSDVAAGGIPSSAESRDKTAGHRRPPAVSGGADYYDYGIETGDGEGGGDASPAQTHGNTHSAKEVQPEEGAVEETEDNIRYEHNLGSNLISPGSTGTDNVEPSMLSMKQFHDNKGNPEPRVNVTFNAPKEKGVYDMYIDRKGRRCSDFTELPLDVEYLREVFVNSGFSNFQLPSLGVNLNELADKAVFFKDLDDNSILCGTLTINHR